MTRKVYVKDMPRELDERVLDGIRLICKRHTCVSAAKACGICPKSLQMNITRILQADIEESGEDFVTVKRAYP